MKFLPHTVLLAAGILASFAAQAQVTVTDAWVRATVPAQQATGAFMQLQAAKDSKLVGVTSSLTPAAEVHEMAMQDGVMKMRQIPFIDLPAGKTVALKPGSYHIMLMKLTQQVKEGQNVDLTLVLEDADGKRSTQPLQVPVRALQTAQPAGHGHGHQH